MIKYSFISLLILLGFITSSELEAQNSFPKDSVIIFNSPRPLIQKDEIREIFSRKWGIEMNVSNHGFGMGAYWSKEISGIYSYFFRFDAYSPKGTKPEWEQFNRNTGQIEVFNKINRIYSFPLVGGFKLDLFKESLSRTITPHFMIGGGPTYVMSLPYRENRDILNPRLDIFSSFKDINHYFRFGGFAEIGSGINLSANNVINLHIRYYYIPFGDNGIESTINDPITNLGGIFLGASISFSY